MGLLFGTKRGDTSGSLVVRLSRSDGSAVDLSGATAYLILRNRTFAQPVLRVACALDNTAKTATYAWQPDDVATVAELLGEIEVTYADGTVETFPGVDADGRPLYLKIVIAPDLGDAP